MLDDLKGKCKVCSTEFSYRRGKLFCSPSCKQKSFRFTGLDVEVKALKLNDAPKKEKLCLDRYYEYLDFFMEMSGIQSKMALMLGDVGGCFLMPEFMFLIRNYTKNEPMSKELFDYFLLLYTQHEKDERKVFEDSEYKDFRKKIYSGFYDISI